jgi:AcrR family transcriptional regulator
MEEDLEHFWRRLGPFLRRVPRQSRARTVVTAVLDVADASLELAESGAIQPMLVRAGIAAGSFYEYFASRDALLAATVERISIRNFSSFLVAIDERTAALPTLEAVVREGAELIVEAYLRRPTHLRTIIRLTERLGLIGEVTRERDRFAQALTVRVARFTQHMSDEARTDMMRAVADALMGVVVVSVHRSPIPATSDVSRAGADVAWAITRLHTERALETETRARKTRDRSDSARVQPE